LARNEHMWEQFGQFQRCHHLHDNEYKERKEVINRYTDVYHIHKDKSSVEMETGDKPEALWAKYLIILATHTQALAAPVKYLTTSRRFEATFFRLSDAKTQIRLIPQRAGTGSVLQQQDFVLVWFSSASQAEGDSNRYPCTQQRKKLA